MNEVPIGPAPETCPELLRLFGVIAFDPRDDAVFYMNPQGASSATVEGCGSPYDLFLTAHFLGIHYILLQKQMKTGKKIARIRFSEP
jgi:hypothetical protein